MIISTNPLCILQDNQFIFPFALYKREREMKAHTTCKSSIKIGNSPQVLSLKKQKKT